VSDTFNTALPFILGRPGSGLAWHRLIVAAFKFSQGWQGLDMVVQIDLLYRSYPVVSLALLLSCFTCQRKHCYVHCCVQAGSRLALC
jgi:hypothetical protein